MDVVLWNYCFFFKDTATTEIYTYCHTLSLHDALPICQRPVGDREWRTHRNRERSPVAASPGTGHLSIVIRGDDPSVGLRRFREAPSTHRDRKKGKIHVQIHVDRIGHRAHRRTAVEPARTGAGRSEEHTSELQSLMRTSYAVFCLKQKKTYTQ